jgi:hypothetical protein
MLFEISCLLGLLVVVIILYRIFITIHHIRIDLLDQQSHQAEVKYWKSKALADPGNEEYDALLTIIYNDLLHPRKREKNRIKIYERLKALYGESFTRMGHEFPPFPFKQVESKSAGSRFMGVISGGKKAG